MNKLFSFFQSESFQYKLEEAKRNRATIGAITIIVAIIMGFVIIPMISDSLKNRTRVICIKSDIEEGELITADKLNTIVVGGFGLPSNVIKDIKLVENSYAVVNLKAGTILLNNMFQSTFIQKDSKLYSLDGFQRAISFTNETLSKSLSDKLLVGDIISIYATHKEEKTTRLPDELKYVEVIGLSTNLGNDFSQDDKQSTKKGESKDKISIDTITVLTQREEQALMVASLEQSSTLHSALVYRGNDTKIKNYFLDAQLDLLKGKYVFATQSIIDIDKAFGRYVEPKKFIFNFGLNTNKNTEKITYAWTKPKVKFKTKIVDDGVSQVTIEEPTFESDGSITWKTIEVNKYTYDWKKYKENIDKASMIEESKEREAFGDEIIDMRHKLKNINSSIQSLILYSRADYDKELLNMLSSGSLIKDRSYSSQKNDLISDIKSRRFVDYPLIQDDGSITWETKSIDESFDFDAYFDHLDNVNEYIKNN